MSFEVFAAHVNDMVGQDRDWTNLVFVMHLGKRLFTTTSSVGVDLRDYFGRFLAGAFGEEIAQSGGTVSFFVFFFSLLISNRFVSMLITSLNIDVCPQLNFE